MARRGAEKLAKTGSAVPPPREVEAIQFWWLEAQREHGFISDELAKPLFGGMLATLKQGGIRTNKEKVQSVAARRLYTYIYIHKYTYIYIFI